MILVTFPELCCIYGKTEMIRFIKIRIEPARATMHSGTGRSFVG